MFRCMYTCTAAEVFSIVPQLYFYARLCIFKVVHKASSCSRKYKTIFPTNCPYIVHLNKFFETDYAIYLLLQHATGGKLWNYIGSYLTGRHGSKHLGDVDDSQVCGGNVYAGVKLHEDDNAISDSKGLDVCSEKTTSVSKVLHSSENSDLKFLAEGSNVTSDILDINVKFSNSKSDKNVKHVTSDDAGSSQKKPDYSRFESISSEENFNDSDMSEFRNNSYEQRDSTFQDLLKNNTTHLENFSINSFDSTDDHSRLNSFVSDPVSTILEESELSPSHSIPRTESDNVFSEERALPEDAKSIVQNSKALIKAVERTLSQSDVEIKKEIASDSEDRDSCKEISDGVSRQSEVVTSGNSSDTMIDDSDSNELSIYDIHRNKEETSSSGSSEDQLKCHTTEEIDPTEDCDRKDTLVSSAMEDLCKDLSENASRKSSRSSTLVDNSERKNSIPVAKLSIKRLNSTELCRSATMEHELTSPPRSRQRTVSDVFKELDSTAAKSEQILIPEACIRHWMAEIVTAISKLHSEGIICRYTKSTM